MSIKNRILFALLIPTIVFGSLIVAVVYFLSKENNVATEIWILIITLLVLFQFIVSHVLSKGLGNDISSSVSNLASALKDFEQDESRSNVVVSKYAEFVDLLKEIDNFAQQLRNQKVENKKVTEECEKKSKELEQSLEVQKQATIKVLKEIEEEKSISEHRAQELKKFQLAVENASDHIVITDVDGYIIYTNNACKKITGFTSEEVIGTKAGKLWGGQMDKEYYKKMWDTISVNKLPYTNEIINKRKNGTDYTAEINIIPILDKEDKVIFYVSVERDITTAKEVDRMKTDFISIASHQLRTPLASIRWGLDLLLSGDFGSLKEKQQEYVKDAFDSTIRLTTLVNDLLNISRIESGRLIVEPYPTDMRDLIESVISDVIVELSKKQHKIELKIDSKLPKINLDPNLMRNVYLNFITNAIKYTPSNGLIEIGAYIEGGFLYSFVRDNGYGIPEEEKPQIFERFYRANNVRQVHPDGTGLGLYLVKAIIEASEGIVWFDSEQDKGTTFWFKIPLTGMKAKEGEVSIEG